MNLTSTTHSLRLETNTAQAVEWTASYTTIDKTGATAVTAGSGDGSVSAITTTEVVPAPGSSTITRTLTSFSVTNTGTLRNTVRVLKRISGVDRAVTPRVQLDTGETLFFAQHCGWQVLDAKGNLRTRAEGSKTGGFTLDCFKVGTAPEATGQWYCYGKDSGAPGAWSPGTPGLAGRVTDGTAAPDNGCMRVPNAVGGANYVTEWGGASSQPGMTYLFDILWVNSGAVVTTLTAQTIGSPTLPARDLNGTTNGEGCRVGLLITTATTNAAAITNITLSYTNSDGVAGRTATMANFPATGVIGTTVWFQLQAGDTGVRSVQSITLGTSLVAGAISVFIARAVANFGVIVAGAQSPDQPTAGGSRLYDGACLIPIGLMANTTATTINAIAKVELR